MLKTARSPFLLALLLLLPLRGLSAETIPKLLFWSDHHSEWPLFVAADAAFNGQGELAEELFDPGSLSGLRSLIREPRLDGCIHVEEGYDDITNAPDLSTLDRAFATARLVVFGEVVAKEAGFHGGEPGQLLAIAASQVVGETGHHQSLYYVFFPLGRFKAGPYEFCKTDRRVTSAPSVGEEVIAFAVAHYPVSEPFFHIAPEAGVVLLRRDGGVELPSLFREQQKAPLRRADLLGKLDRAARRRK